MANARPRVMQNHRDEMMGTQRLAARQPDVSDEPRDCKLAASIIHGWHSSEAKISSLSGISGAKTNIVPAANQQLDSLYAA